MAVIEQFDDRVTTRRRRRWQTVKRTALLLAVPFVLFGLSEALAGARALMNVPNDFAVFAGTAAFFVVISGAGWLGWMAVSALCDMTDADGEHK